MKFYRYEEVQLFSGVTLTLRVYNLIKETPCGYWISKYSCDSIFLQSVRKRWVSKTSRKRFAYPTKEEAMINFKARKRRQIALLTGQLDQAKDALMIAENGNKWWAKRLAI